MMAEKYANEQTTDFLNKKIPGNKKHTLRNSNSENTHQHRNSKK